MYSDQQNHWVALKTLKQRCEYLQKRLDVVEEENRRLKLEKIPDTQASTNKSATFSNNSTLEKQVVLLSQQKSQMSHQIQMITNENQILWSHLCKSMPGDNDLSEKLTLSTFHENKTKPVPMDTSSIMLDDGKESLEEISLKLINGILMGKIELENQYSQMIDLQKENSSSDIKNFSFSLKTDNRSALSSLKNYEQKLRDFKQALNQQKNELSNAITKFKKFKNRAVINKTSEPGGAESSAFKFAQNVDDLQDVRLTNRIDNNSEEKICPICENQFSGNFTEFHSHVCAHFDDENEEYLDASSTFEVVP